MFVFEVFALYGKASGISAWEECGVFTRKINIDSVEKVKTLVGEATAVGFDMEVVSERHNANAKSILGIFSVNRNSPVTLVIHADEDDEEVKGFLKKISDFLM